METGKIKLLKWFIEFAYTEFEQIGIGETVKKAMELQEILENGLWHDDVFSETLEMAKGRLTAGDNLLANLENMVKVQKTFRESFEAIMNTIKGMQKSANIQWVKVEELTELIPLDRRPNVNLSLKVNIFPSIEHKESAEGFLYKWKDTWPSESIFSIRSEIETWSGDLLLIVFYRVLNFVRIGYFRECQECNKWFLHVTKRERVYCSNRCAARKANKERRSKDKKNNENKYKKELENNAIRARKSYVNKEKVKNPNAIIARRPWKYKKSEG